MCHGGRRWASGTMGVKPLEEQARSSADFNTLAPAMNSAASGNQQWDNTTEIIFFWKASRAFWFPPASPFHLPGMKKWYPSTYFPELSFFTHNKHFFLHSFKTSTSTEKSQAEVTSNNTVKNPVQSYRLRKTCWHTHVPHMNLAAHVLHHPNVICEALLFSPPFSPSPASLK